MPNWCSNRMHFSGEPAQIAEIKRLASGAVTPLYRRATNEGIQLFLAGSAGLLQITENIRSEQCPGVTAAGRGAVSTENIAFTRWLTHLQNGVSGISCGPFPCCVRVACWSPSVSTDHASRRSCYRFLTSARSCRAARLLIPMSRR